MGVAACQAKQANPRVMCYCSGATIPDESRGDEPDPWYDALAEEHAFPLAKIQTAEHGQQACLRSSTLSAHAYMRGPSECHCYTSTGFQKGAFSVLDQTCLDVWEWEKMPAPRDQPGGEDDE